MICRSEVGRYGMRFMCTGLYTMYTRKNRHVYRPQPLCHKGLKGVCTLCTQKKYDTYIEKNIFYQKNAPARVEM